jgi:hypothetical protein
LVATVKLYGTLDATKEKIEETLQFDAKVVAAMQRIYTERLNKHEIPANTSFKEFLKQNAGGEVSGRVQAMANLFNTLVLTLDKNGKPMVPEVNFDDAKVSWLEAANAIIKQARKENGENWLTSDPVLDVVNALTKIGDAGKKLKAIRKRQKGEPAESADTETGETVLPLTVGRAFEHLKAAIANASKMPQSEAADLYEGCFNLMGEWDNSNVSKEDLGRWTDNITYKRPVNLVIVREPAPAEKPESDIAALVAA